MLKVERLDDPPQTGFRHQPTRLWITAIGPARILFAPADAGDMLSRR